MKLSAGRDEKYEIDRIRDSTVYTKELEGHLPGLYS